ncbi:MAG: outer membrane beta-barrel protein [Flavisolibacter sp.]
MKTITLFCLASLFFAFSANSQISKGAVLLGGNLGFSKSDIGDAPDEYKNHSFYFSPSIGFVVKENKVFGVNLSYGHGINQTSATDKSVSNNYGGGIFYRRYLPLGKSFYLYGQGQLQLDFGEQEYKTSATTSERTTNYVGLGLFPGVAYAISKRFHLEISMNNLVSLGYSSIKENYTTSQELRNSQFNFSVNANPASNLALGFRILLGNK